MIKHTQTIRRQKPTSCWLCLTTLSGWRFKELTLIDQSHPAFDKRKKIKTVKIAKMWCFVDIAVNQQFRYEWVSYQVKVKHFDKAFEHFLDKKENLFHNIIVLRLKNSFFLIYIFLVGVKHKRYHVVSRNACTPTSMQARCI